jgi:hypothetical protein
MGLIPHAPKLTALTAGSLLLASSAMPALAAPSFTLEGNASRSDDTITLTSDFNSTNNNQQFGDINLKVPNDLQLSEITRLSATVTPAAGDDCGGGSPRFQLNVGGKNVFVYFGSFPNFDNCSGGTSLNLANTTDARFDLSQLGGSQYSTYQQALDLLGNQTITGIQLVVDSGWFMSDKDETFTVTDLKFKTTEDNNGGNGGGGNGGTPTSKQDCKRGGWQTFTNPTFTNQGQCVSWVNHHNGIGNDDDRHGDDQDENDQGGKHKNKDKHKGHDDEGNED